MRKSNSVTFSLMSTFVLDISVFLNMTHVTLDFLILSDIALFVFCRFPLHVLVFFPILRILFRYRVPEILYFSLILPALSLDKVKTFSQLIHNLFLLVVLSYVVILGSISPICINPIPVSSGNNILSSLITDWLLFPKDSNFWIFPFLFWFYPCRVISPFIFGVKVAHFSFLLYIRPLFHQQRLYKAMR